MKKKKIILISIFCLEIIIGGTFLFNFYQKIITQRKILGLKKVAIIDKETIIPANDSKFEYYWQLAPNTIVEDSPGWLPYKAIYHYNADGLNERFNYPIEKEDGVFRIITLGDSFTYGHYVNTEDNWTEKLEDLLNADLSLYNFKKFEVINLGMGGFDIPYINERYKTIGSKYNPDLIIWFESGSGLTRYYELMAPMIEICQEKINEDFKEKENVTSLQKQLAGYGCWDNAEKQMVQQYSLERITEMLKTHLDDFFAHVDPKKVIFFTAEDGSLPDNERKTLDLWRKSYPEAIFSSTIPNIYNMGGALEDGHPNNKGHLIIANNIFDYLQDNILLDNFLSKP